MTRNKPSLIPLFFNERTELSRKRRGEKQESYMNASEYLVRWHRETGLFVFGRCPFDIRYRGDIRTPEELPELMTIQRALLEWPPIFFPFSRNVSNTGDILFLFEKEARKWIANAILRSTDYFLNAGLMVSRVSHKTFEQWAMDTSNIHAQWKG